MNKRIFISIFTILFGLCHIQGQAYQYDVNQDGVVNISDAILVVNKILDNSNNTNGDNTDPTSPQKKDMEEWANLGTGIFIHWGVYSALAGHYTGYDRKGNYVDSDVDALSEWIFNYKNIPDETYKSYESQFTASEWDAEEIAKMAYDCGMKYIVITAKHHEGFTLYDSQFANWDISTSGAAGKDPLMDLKKACEKYGLKFCLYFSQFRDWMAEGGFGQSWKNNNIDPYTEQQHMDYVDMTINIIKEMMIKYEPYVLWYDGPIAEKKYADKIYATQQEFYPNVIVNWRLYKDYSIGDFATGEATYFYGDRDLWKYAETCFTSNGGWGYWAKLDTQEKTRTANHVIGRYFIISRARNQNVLVNIGPKADGSVSPYIRNLFNEVSKYVQKYGSFDNTRSPNVHSYPNWGRILQKGNVLKLYVMDGSSTINLDGILTNSISQVRVYDTDNEFSNDNYQILSDRTITISNIPTHQDFSPAVVDVVFNDSIISETYSNILDDKHLILSSLAFNSHRAEYYVGCFDEWKRLGWRMAGWKDSKGWIETYFKYEGTTGQYNVKARVPNGSKPIATAVLTDLSDSSIQSFTYTQSAQLSSTPITLINGKTYKLRITHDDTGSMELTNLTFINVPNTIQPVTYSQKNTSRLYDLNGRPYLPFDKNKELYIVNGKKLKE